MAEQAAEQLADEGIECEIVDPRTTSPLDEETIFESVENTGRLVVVDEANPRCSLATDIVARVAQNGFNDLEAAPKMVTAPHTPPPFSPTGGPLRPRSGAHSRRRSRDNRFWCGALMSETRQISKLGMPKWASR